MHVHSNLASQRAHNIAIKFFGDHLDEFQRYLLGQSHAESTVVQFLRCIGTLAEMMKAHGVGLAGLDEAQAVTLIAKKGLNRNRRNYATFIAKRFIRFLNERGIARLPLPHTAKQDSSGRIEAGLRALSAPPTWPQRGNGLPFLALRRPLSVWFRRKVRQVGEGTLGRHGMYYQRWLG
jgi:hypothetical protein